MVNFYYNSTLARLKLLIKPIGPIVLIDVTYLHRLKNLNIDFQFSVKLFNKFAV